MFVNDLFVHDVFVHDVRSPRVIFGAGSLDQVPAEVEGLGARRALLIAGRHEKAYADRLAAALHPVARIEDVAMHVPADTAAAATRRAILTGADLVVAVGGGSATGLAKVIAKETGVRILAVPTTYAGSEMNPVWGLTDKGRKRTGRDPRVLPHVVVYDPELTASLPATVSAASGMNAIAHSVEAMYTQDASPVTRLIAVEGIRVLADVLPRVTRRTDDIAARGEALYGAWLCGAALAGATMGLHHTICHVLGGGYDLPHAPTHSAVLPYAVAYNEPHAGQAMARVADALGGTGTGPAATAAALWDLAHRIGAPTSLAALGFAEASAEEAARLVVAAAPPGPRTADLDGVRDLLLAACAGHPPEAFRR